MAHEGFVPPMAVWQCASFQHLRARRLQPGRHHGRREGGHHDTLTCTNSPTSCSCRTNLWQSCGCSVTALMILACQHWREENLEFFGVQTDQVKIRWRRTEPGLKLWSSHGFSRVGSAHYRTRILYHSIPIVGPSSSCEALILGQGCAKTIRKRKALETSFQAQLCASPLPRCASMDCYVVLYCLKLRGRGTAAAVDDWFSACFFLLRLSISPCCRSFQWLSYWLFGTLWLESQ